jgi:hypothetical protein
LKSATCLLGGHMCDAWSHDCFVILDL